MIIGWWFRHLELTGTCDKKVECAHCHGVFVYPLTRRVAYDTPIFPGSLVLLQKTCQRQLTKRLAQDVVPMSCPSCGWIQADMVRELRRRFLAKIRQWAQFLIFGLLGIIALIGIGALWVTIRGISMRGIDFDWIGMILACLAGAAFGGLLILLRIGLARSHYPSAGFMPRKCILSRESRPQVVTTPAIKPVAFA